MASSVTFCSLTFSSSFKFYSSAPNLLRNLLFHFRAPVPCSPVLPYIPTSRLFRFGVNFAVAALGAVGSFPPLLFPSLHLSLILISFSRSPFPLPGPGPSCGGSGLGAPVIPPSRAGFPLRPRPLEGLGVSSPPGRSATTCGAGSCPGWRGSLCPLPGRLGGGGVCRLLAALGYSAGRAALILTVPGGGTGPGASRLRRTPSAVRGGQLGIGDLVGPWLKAFGGGLCGPLLDCCRGLGVWPFLFPWAPYTLPFRFSLARLMAFCGALFTVEIAPRKVDPLRPLARSGAA